MKPNVEAEHHVAVLAEFEQRIHPAAQALVIASQARTDRFQGCDKGGDEIDAQVPELVQDFGFYLSAAIIVPESHPIKGFAIGMLEIASVGRDAQGTIGCRGNNGERLW